MPWGTYPGISFVEESWGLASCCLLCSTWIPVGEMIPQLGTSSCSPVNSAFCLDLGLACRAVLRWSSEVMVITAVTWDLEQGWYPISFFNVSGRRVYTQSKVLKLLSFAQAYLIEGKKNVHFNPKIIPAQPIGIMCKNWTWHKNLALHKQRLT